MGYLSAGSRDQQAEDLRAFRPDLGDTGYGEGRNLGIEYRLAEVW
jgi:hypothetical protein